MNEQSLIHKGHRQRMKDKLLRHGARIFDTYELLEMLLYQVIPYRDTNPISKRLLERFGSLQGVFSAEVSELSEVDGIGERAAEFISLLGKYGDVSALPEEPVPTFEDSESAGRFFVEYFDTHKDKSVAMLLLDNAMRLIGLETVECTSFGSAAVKPRYFVDAAMRLGAGNVLVACNHRYSSLFFTDSEIATYRSVKLALSDIRVPLAASYIISGNKYKSIKGDMEFSLSASSPELGRFMSSIKEGVITVE